jgi:predicted dehydrogenase
MKKLSCALVGFGGIGHHHASRYAHCKNVRLVAICDIDPARLEEAQSATNLGGSGALDLSKVRRYASYDALAAAERGRIDMIDLCVPTYEHARLACRALRDGFHVLSEKPMALSLAQCDAMIAAAKESGRLHMVAQCLRFSPVYEALRAAVRDGRFGALRSLSLHRVGAMPWSKWYYDHRKCGGAVLDLQLHDLDFAVSLLGTPAAIRTEGLRGPSGGWDETVSRLRYPGRDAPLVTTMGSWLRAAFQPGFEAVFERGLVTYADGKLEAFDAKRKPAKLPPRKDADMYGLEIDYFAGCILRGERPERCLPESTRESVRLALLQMKSAARGGAWVKA